SLARNRRRDLRRQSLSGGNLSSIGGALLRVGACLLDLPREFNFAKIRRALPAHEGRATGKQLTISTRFPQIAQLLLELRCDEQSGEPVAEFLDRICRAARCRADRGHLAFDE